MENVVAIVNPKAAGGRALRVWPAYAEALRDAGVACRALETEGPGHAIELTRTAIESGAETVIAVGGDGAANEVVNGFFSEGRPILPAARFSYVPVGTGADLQRTLQVPTDPGEAARVIAAGKAEAVDVGYLRLTGPDGKPVERMFLNLASFGMGGDVSIASKRTPLAKLSGKLAFLYGTFSVFLRYRGRTVRLWLDDAREPLEFDVTNVALGNGRFHGGGMHPCPRASMTDGLLDVTVIERLGMFELIRDIRVLYSDDVYVHPKVHGWQAKRIRVEGDALAEVDGEALGGAPLEAEIRPAALQLIRP